MKHAVGVMLMGAGVLWCVAVIAGANWFALFMAVQNQGGLDPIHPAIAVAVGTAVALPFCLPGVVVFFVGVWAWKGAK
jgi:hypothetical protein